ncbi:MAG: ice-binding family protein, partial [Chloroflexota bacterium]
MKFKVLTFLLILSVLFVTAGTGPPAVTASPGAEAPDLGTAASFVGLAGSTFTNTGSGVYYGNVGVYPGTAVIGFPPGEVRDGAIYGGGAVPMQAQIDAATAYNALALQSCDTNLTDQNLGGQTLQPGVYCFDTSAQLTGDLVLDALGDANAVWVFKIGSTLTTASGATVGLINGGQALNVFWQVGSSATLGTTTLFSGNILAYQSITLDTGAGLVGRALALNGAVTMDTNGSPPITNAPTYTLTVNIVGQGNVTAEPPGTVILPPGTMLFPYTFISGTVVTLEAVPAALWYFAGWSGDLGGSANP